MNSMECVQALMFFPIVVGIYCLCVCDFKNRFGQVFVMRIPSPQCENYSNNVPPPNILVIQSKIVGYHFPLAHWFKIDLFHFSLDESSSLLNQRKKKRNKDLSAHNEECKNAFIEVEKKHTDTPTFSSVVKNWNIFKES